MSGRAPSPGTSRTQVLVISASMGAGHDGAAEELSRRLVDAGHQVEVRDLLTAVPAPIAVAWREGYYLQARRFPAAYERSYGLYYSRSSAWSLLLRGATALCAGAIARWVDGSGAQVVVSTYPLATVVLGELRRTGRLQLPVVNLLTDMGVHPRCVHECVDLNLVPHDVSARQARLLARTPTVTAGPLVHPAFRPASVEERTAARRALGLSPQATAVLVVAGSRMLGEAEATVEDLLADGRFSVVVACGRDQRLRARLEARRSPRLTALGWTDDMPGVLAGVDVVVENAGGRSAFEAMAAGVPIVTYRPIAGHGRDNARAMVDAGLSELPDSPQALAEAVLRLSRPGAARDLRTRAGLALVRDDAVDLVVAAGGGSSAGSGAQL